MKVKSHKAIPPYLGNSPYCYANSTAMLLASIGESVSPSQIEVLSGVGLGAFILKKTNLLFFSWELPDNGIDHALQILGFSCKAKKVPKTEPVPITELKKDLRQSPAVIGPLDMGYLIYNPDYQFHLGVDHFVLAYKTDDKEIYLHDPAGFPHVSLPLDQLKLAWKAEGVDYGKDFYRYWTEPKRVKRPTEEEIYKQAIQLFKSIYEHSERKANQENWIIGRRAILTGAKRVDNKETSQDEIEQLTYFALPLGTKRALDFASFFEGYDNNLASLKHQQAQLFGRCQTLAVRKDWSQLARTLEALAAVEEEFRLALMAK